MAQVFVARNISKNQTMDHIILIGVHKLWTVRSISVVVFLGRYKGVSNILLKRYIYRLDLVVLFSYH